MTSPATTATSRKLAASSFTSSNLPPLTPEQDSALNTVVPLRDSDTLACLRFIRSIKPGFQPRPGIGPYSPAEVHALQCLSSEPDEEVHLWLILCRRQRQSGLSQTDVSSQGSSLRENLAAGKASYADVVKAGPNIKHPVSAERAHEPPSTAKYLPVAPTHIGHRYWSTAPDHKQPFETFDGFRRHEKERENYYEFLPNGPYERSGPESRCALCLEMQPDKAHFEMHGIGEHIESAKATIKKSRKGNFEELLKKHNVPDHRINRLVEEWHHTPKKKSYSCGLCITHFNTHTQRLNHLKSHHYEKGQDKTMWSSNNLIKGLLLEPQVNREYQKCFGMNPSGKDSKLTWDPSVVQGLQERLELGEEKPWDLAQAAWKLARRSEPSSGDQDILAASSQSNIEELQPMDVMTPLEKGYSNSVPNAAPATSPKVFSTAAARYAQNAQYFGVQMGAPEASLGFAQDTLSDINDGSPFLEESFVFNNAALHGTGSLFEAPTTYEDAMRPHVNDGTVINELHEMDLAPVDTASSFVHATAPSTCGTSSHQIHPWHPPLQVVDPHQTARSTSVRIPQPKRQLSLNTAVAAHSRPHRISPMESQLGPGSPWQR